MNNLCVFIFQSYQRLCVICNISDPKMVSMVNTYPSQKSLSGAAVSGHLVLGVRSRVQFLQLYF